MFGQMCVNPEANFAITTVKGSRIGGTWFTKGGVDVDFVEMTRASFVFLQMALGSKADGASIASMRPFKNMNLGV